MIKVCFVVNADLSFKKDKLTVVNKLAGLLCDHVQHSP